ncbi:MAG: efflux RND transporter periplasmic adaptor subunit [Acidobacteria bacterium]|nr:MAG: efflux RND transporter periplasmic adaptor subunit [Acidobacteriota bacterium]
MTTSPKAFTVAAAAVLVSIGAGGFWVVDRFVWHTPAPAPASPAMEAPAAAERSAIITLTPEMAARAGIETTAVRAGEIRQTLRSPGTVTPNAYQQTIVSAVAGGTVTAVRARLGDAVRDGQILVELFSRDYAEAEHMLLSAQASLDLAQKRRERSEKLAAIGGVSAQEVDEAKAEEARQFHAVDDASARLRLFGPVRAPTSGIVTRREVNTGQNIQAGAELLTISNLSTVWIEADIYERDLAAVRVGADARVTSRAYPGETFTGRVTYLDPQISADTRTLKARIEVANAARKLRFGMLVDVELSGAAVPAGLLVPRSAIQQIGGRSLVFVADPAASGRYEAREVQLGISSGDEVEVKSGLLLKEAVVTAGSFALRAEWERKGGL